VHGLGLLHGAVKASNLFLDANRRFQKADCCPIRLEIDSVEPFSGKGWTPTADVSGFVSLLSEITVRRNVSSPIRSMDDPSRCTAVAEFVWRLIEDGRSPKSLGRFSFVDIVERVKRNHVQKALNVHSEGVSAFVSFV
jgi:hypothetical protein